jgi:hypothetical protein
MSRIGVTRADLSTGSTQSAEKFGAVGCCRIDPETKTLEKAGPASFLRLSIIIIFTEVGHPIGVMQLIGVG